MLVLAVIMALGLGLVPAHASNVDVTIAGFQYAPSGKVGLTPIPVGAPVVVDVPAGTPASAPTVTRPGIVRFTNRDPVLHNVTKLSGPAGTWDFFNVAANGGIGTLSISATFATGTYTYQCTLHSGMRGAFTVA